MQVSINENDIFYRYDVSAYDLAGTPLTVGDDDAEPDCVYDNRGLTCYIEDATSGEYLQIG